VVSVILISRLIKKLHGNYLLNFDLGEVGGRESIHRKPAGYMYVHTKELVLEIWLIVIKNWIHEYFNLVPLHNT
jgi:hypothetical protein